MDKLSAKGIGMLDNALSEAFDLLSEVSICMGMKVVHPEGLSILPFDRLLCVFIDISNEIKLKSF